MPEALSERVMNALKADPRTVDLRALAPHFYSLSERILELFEEEEMVDVLSDVCCFPHVLRSPLTTAKSRLSRSEQLRLLTTHITRVVR